MSVKYAAHGKLLITGEYVILDGALSLAFPCSKGQIITCDYNSSGSIFWESFDYQNECWFSVMLDASLHIVQTTDVEKATFIQSILSFCYSKADATTLAPIQKGIHITTHLSFPNNWGLGSSSTLLVLVAQLFNINAFDLHFSQTNGSGYDIACGMYDQPLLYQLEATTSTPLVQLLTNKPFSSFKEDIYFIHLNQKQKSDREVASYSQLKKEIDLIPICDSISSITKQLLEVNNLSLFNELIETHEAILSNVLQRNTIKEDLFQLYKGGTIKSLGAWGGDFVMATGQAKDMDYFREKGYSTIVKFDDMML